MKSFGNIAAQDHVIDSFSANSRLEWLLVSSSNGVEITNLVGVDGAVTITRATNDIESFYNNINTAPKNIETDTYEYLLYRSVNHFFYKNNNFWTGTTITSSVLPPDNSYVVSIAGEMYGDRISPSTFQLELIGVSSILRDDGYGNLFVSQSGTGSYVGHIFYDHGVAVIPHNIAAATASITPGGIKIVENTQIAVIYQTDFKIYRHEINVKLKPTDFNFSMANPSLRNTYTASGQAAEQFAALNIPTTADDDSYPLYRLMQAGVIKPYVTTIGLYNDRYELLAVAKLSTPIQRTFDTDQIFIVRFDV
jgi:hypothetical protein